MSAEFTTTPRALMGDVSPTLAALGFADCPLDITVTGQGDHTLYEALLGVEPLQTRRLVDFLNAAAPHDVPQTASSIQNDWEFAKDPESRVYKDHQKMGEPWFVFARQVDQLLAAINIRSAEVTPLLPRIAWVDRTHKNGFSTEWQLDTIEAGDATPRRDALIGLVAVAGYSPNIYTDPKVWRPYKGLPKNDAVQAMGGAQVPLLALVNKYRLASADFVNHIRQLAA